DGAKPFSGFSKAKAALEKTINHIRKRDGREPMKQWQLHDLRRTARSLLSKLTSPDTAERVIGHVIPGMRGTYDCYGYYDEKKDALQKLDALINRILNPSDNVASLEQARQARKDPASAA